MRHCPRCGESMAFCACRLGGYTTERDCAPKWVLVALLCGLLMVAALLFCGGGQ